MTEKRGPDIQASWVDEPLFAMKMPEKKPQRERPDKVTWVRTNHLRFSCEQCVTNLERKGQSSIRAAAYVRHYGKAQEALCLLHAEQRKLADTKAGLWKST